MAKTSVAEQDRKPNFAQTALVFEVDPPREDLQLDKLTLHTLLPLSAQLFLIMAISDKEQVDDRSSERVEDAGPGTIHDAAGHGHAATDMLVLLDSSQDNADLLQLWQLDCPVRSRC